MIFTFIKLIFLKIKLLFFRRSFYVLFHTVVFVFKNFILFFKGGSIVGVQLRNSFFGESSLIDSKSKLSPHGNRLAFRKTFLTLEELDKLKIRHGLTLDLLRFYQQSYGLYRYKTVAKNDYSFLATPLVFSVVLKEKFRVLFNSGSFFWKAIIFLRNCSYWFTILRQRILFEIIYFAYHHKFLHRIFFRQSWFTTFMLIFKQRKIVSEPSSSKILIFYKLIVEDYARSKKLIQTDIFEIFISLKKYFFFLLIFRFYDVLRFYIHSFFFVFKIVFLRFFRFIVSSAFSVILFFFSRVINFIFKLFSLLSDKVKAGLVYLKFVLFYLTNRINFFNNNSSLTVVLIIVKNYVKSLTYGFKVFGFIQKRTLARVNLISIFFSTSRDLKQRLFKTSDLVKKPFFFSNVFGYYYERQLFRRLPGHIHSSAFNDEWMINSRIEEFKNYFIYRTRKLDKSMFNKLFFWKTLNKKKKITNIKFEKLLYSSYKKKVKKSKTSNHKKFRTSLKRIKNNRFRNISYLFKRSNNANYLAGSLFKLQSHFATPFRASLINAASLNSYTHFNKPARYKSINVSNLKRIKINFYDFFKKSDYVLDRVKAKLAINRFRNRFLDSKKNYLGMSFFLSNFIHKREKFWNFSTYELGGALPIVLKFRKLWEENFILCYRLCQKLMSGFYLPKSQPLSYSTEAAKFLIIFKSFELQRLTFISFFRFIWFFSFLFILFSAYNLSFKFCFNLLFILTLFTNLLNFLLFFSMLFIFGFYIHHLRFVILINKIKLFYSQPKKLNFFLVNAVVLTLLGEFGCLLNESLAYFYVRSKTCSLQLQRTYQSLVVKYFIILLCFLFNFLCLTYFFKTFSFDFSIIIVVFFSYLLTRLYYYTVLLSTINTASSNVFWRYLIFVNLNSKVAWDFFHRNKFEKLYDFLFPIPKNCFLVSTPELLLIRQLLRVELNLETRLLNKLQLDLENNRLK